MIKKLRFKFVCVVMLIVTVMLCTILGVIVHFTGSIMEMQSISMMRSVAASPFQLGIPGEISDGIRLPFFTVQVGTRGEILSASSGYYDLSDIAFLQEVVDAALTDDSDTGRLDAYNLRFCKVVSRTGQNIVFSDTSSEQATLKNLFYTCLLIGFAALLVFLGVSILLSHWAIRPVAQAWTQQRQFVADASHELKTPLSVIMANAELLQNEDISQEDRNKFSKNILSTTYQMRSLVENMLEMARVDNGTLKMRFTTVDFSQLVTDAVLSFQLLYEEHALGLESTVPEGISLHGSEQHLYQVLDVLLDNALKYSTPRGTVCVSMQQLGRSCVLSVASPGEPISKDDLKNIFKRFYRADKARAMNGSYGLGLSIAESIVLSHKGKIWAESTDGNNIFRVQLPIL